jgi:ribose transport system permease protein
VNSRLGFRQITQQQIVFAIACVLFVIFALTLKQFVAYDNLLSLLGNVSILGILALGMAITIIGRGIDLAIVTTMVMSVSWVMSEITQGRSLAAALAMGLIFVVAIGIIEGILIAYVEIPAIFTTLALSGVIYGFSRLALTNADLVYVPESVTWARLFGTGHVLGIPMPVILFAISTTLVGLFLQYTRPGRFIRAVGDNPLKSRIAGIPVRPIILLQYVCSSVIAYISGLIMVALIGSMNTRMVNSTIVYDVILVVVLGGVGLSGGRGGVLNVIAGTLLIGVLLNGMTILDVPYILQNLLRGLILLIALIIDSLLNPRDEQTSQQGDI